MSPYQGDLSGSLHENLTGLLFIRVYRRHMEFASAILSATMVMTAISTRPASANDRLILERLLGSANLIHNHLDWQPPQDWLGQQPFRFALARDKVAGALAAPPDMPNVAWVRLMAVAHGYAAETVLDPLWAESLPTLRDLGIHQVNCMLLEGWLVPHLQRWGYYRFSDVVVLRRLPNRPTPSIPDLGSLHLRLARPGDLDALTVVDNAAFAAPWQYSRAVIQQALLQSSYVTVAELNGAVVGYQLSSGGRAGGHLARLAVWPQLQGHGIGRLLVGQVVEHFEKLGAPVITVNTQRDNNSSLAVYRAFGFDLTGEHYEVWQWQTM